MQISFWSLWTSHGRKCKKRVYIVYTCMWVRIYIHTLMETCIILIFVISLKLFCVRERSWKSMKVNSVAWWCGLRIWIFSHVHVWVFLIHMKNIWSAKMFKHSNPNDMSKRDKYSSSKKRLYSCNEPKKPTKLNLFLFTKNNFASKLSRGHCDASPAT